MCRISEWINLKEEERSDRDEEMSRPWPTVSGGTRFSKSGSTFFPKPENDFFFKLVGSPVMLKIVIFRQPH